MGFTESKKYIRVRLSIQKTLAAAMIFRITFLSSSRVTCEFRISTTFISYKGLSNSCLLGTCTPMYTRVICHVNSVVKLLRGG